MTNSILLSTINHFLMVFPLDQMTFTQIAKFFNLTIDSPYDPSPLNTLHQKFKNKLFDIFHTEGPRFKDYLMLPKFSSLKPQTQQKLIFLFNNIWFEFQRKMQIQKDQLLLKEVQKLLPDFRTLQQIQEFHLQLFKNFKNSKLCKENKNIDNRPGSFQPTINNQQNTFKRPFQSLSYPSEINDKFNPFYATGNHVRNVFPKVEDEPKYINPIWSRQKYQNPNNFPMHRPIDSPLNAKKDIQKMDSDRVNESQNSQKANEQNIQQSSYQNYKMDQIQQTNHIAQTDEDYLNKLEQYMFIECACEGNKKSQKYMICKQCQYYFHYECLMLDQTNLTDLCPCCKLKQGSNMFVKIHPQPYGKRWCRNLKKQKLSLFLTQKQIQNMKRQKGLCKPTSQIQYQLKFLKIARSKRLNPQSNNNTSNSNIMTRKFSSLPLPTHYIEKIQPFNQFEISLKSAQQKQVDSCVYFFGIFIVEKYSQKVLTQQLFNNITSQNSVGQDYIRKYLNEQQSITIKMKDVTSQRKIQYPVRGDKCQHLQVFDYLSLLEYYKEYGEKLKNKHCSVCENQINSIVVDRFIYEKIRQNENYKNNNEIQYLKYDKDGGIEFLQEQSESSQSEQQNDMNEQNEDNQAKRQNDENQSEQLSC